MAFKWFIVRPEATGASDDVRFRCTNFAPKTGPLVCSPKDKIDYYALSCWRCSTAFGSVFGKIINQERRFGATILASLMKLYV